MADQPYVYDIPRDFPNDQVSLNKLGDEIRGSNIKTALRSITRVGDALTIVMKAALDNADEAILGLPADPGPGTIIGDHDGIPIQKPEAVIIEPTGDLSKSILASGYLFTVSSAPNTYNCDIQWGEDRDLQSGFTEIVNGVEGDTIDVVAVHPITQGELGAYLEHIYVPPSGRIVIEGEGTTTIPAGVILRIKYTVVAGGSDRKLYFTAKTWR